MQKTLESWDSARQGFKTLEFSHKTAGEFLVEGKNKGGFFSTLGYLSSRWILSRAKKDDTDDEIAKYDGESNTVFE